MPHEPVVVVAEQVDEHGVALAGEVDIHRRSEVVNHLEDSAVGPVMLGGVAMVALVGVIPVEEYHLAVGADLERDELRPRVVGEEEVGLAVADVARTRGRKPVLVEPVAVDVVHEELAAVMLRPGTAQVDARTRVGMATADPVRGREVGGVPLVAAPVPVEGDRLDVVEGVGVEVLPRLPLVTSAGNDVVEVRDHAGGLKGMAEVVEVRARGRRRCLRRSGSGLGPPRPAACADRRSTRPPTAGRDRQSTWRSAGGPPAQRRAARSR